MEKAAFEGFQHSKKQVNGININYRIGGTGPPILLIHGYPQTHFIWHKIAVVLSQKYTVVVSDLRGYGDSDCPVTDEQHLPYSKREMAKDQVALMKELGFDAFYLVGHDRGGRVAHRLTLDHPKAVLKLCVLDIAPTEMMYRTTDMEFAKAYFHWFLLIQPFNLPEQLIGSNREYFINVIFRSKPELKTIFTDKAVAEYIRCFDEQTIHGSCEDYRASASIDMEHDQLSISKGEKVACPLLVLWGNKGLIGNKYQALEEWKKVATTVSGKGVDSGHFIPEEAPEVVLQSLLEFMI